MKAITPIISVLWFFLLTISLQAQSLNPDQCESVLLNNGLTVTMCANYSFSDQEQLEYYYLPINLRFGTSKKQSIDFSFLKFQNDQGISGSILHFLITWGLTSDQIEEARDRLSEIKGKNAILIGAAIPQVEDVDGFIIEGSSRLARILNRSKTGVGKASPMANTKIAASFQLNEEDTQFFETAMNKNDNELKNTQLTLSFYINFPPKSYQAYTLKKNFYELLNQEL